MNLGPRDLIEGIEHGHPARGATHGIRKRNAEGLRITPKTRKVAAFHLLRIEIETGPQISRLFGAFEGDNDGLKCGLRGRILYYFHGISFFFKVSLAGLGGERSEVNRFQTENPLGI